MSNNVNGPGHAKSFIQNNRLPGYSFFSIMPVQVQAVKRIYPFQHHTVCFLCSKYYHRELWLRLFVGVFLSDFPGKLIVLRKRVWRKMALPFCARSLSVGNSAGLWMHAATRPVAFLHCLHFFSVHKPA